MTSYFNASVPHPKLQHIAVPRRSSSHWHPYAAASDRNNNSRQPQSPASRSTSSKNRDSTPSEKSKRVSVTACDSCRIRKLKCNSKDLPSGEACSGCFKLGTECTFDDRDTPFRRRPNLSKASVVHGRSNRYGQRGSVQHRDSGVSISPSAAGSKGKKMSSSSQMLEYEHCRKEEYTTSRSHNSWGHEQAGQILASINSSFRMQPKTEIEPALWDNWNIPLFLTNPNTGQRRTVTSQAVVELLLHRFYAQTSFNCIVVPNYTEMLQRLRYGAIPSHLLHTMIACASACDLTTEPELLLWRSQVWHGASESVHYRLTMKGLAELELVQSLLLMATNWSGGLLQMERINTFNTAIDLALSLQLHSGDHLYVNPGPRSTRIMLFWSFYCSDKILSVMTKRHPVICSESHSIPLPSIEDIEAASGLPPKATAAAWLQRLAFAYISLTQITECVQRQLLLPIRQGKIISLDQIYRQILPIERRLENFCKEQRWLLGIVTELSPLCRNLAMAVISQLHFTQLHLYLPALQFEVDRRGSLNQPLHFSPQNDKPLAATIESAWHLVQQPANGTLPNVSSNSQAARAEFPNNLDQSTSLTFSHACVSIGLNFFKFLSSNWAEWDQGNGCVRYAPIQLSQQFLHNIDLNSQVPQRSHRRSPLQEVTSNREMQSNRSINDDSRSSHSQEGNDDVQSQLQAEIGEQMISKRQTSTSHRRKLSTLYIVQSRIKMEVDTTNITPDQLSASSNESVAVSTPARVFLNNQQNHTSHSNGQQQENQTGETPLALLNSHAMLTPIRPDLLHTLQDQKNNREELSELAEILG